MIDNIINTTWIIFCFTLLMSFAFHEKEWKEMEFTELPLKSKIYLTICGFSLNAIPILYIIKIWR